MFLQPKVCLWRSEKLANLVWPSLSRFYRHKNTLQLAGSYATCGKRLKSVYIAESLFFVVDKVRETRPRGEHRDGLALTRLFAAYGVGSFFDVRKFRTCRLI